MKCPACGEAAIYSLPESAKGGRLTVDTSQEYPHCMACPWEGPPEPIFIPCEVCGERAIGRVGMVPVCGAHAPALKPSAA